LGHGGIGVPTLMGKNSDFPETFSIVFYKHEL
jgi:hypothetical protein